MNRQLALVEQCLADMRTAFAQASLYATQEERSRLRDRAQKGVEFATVSLNKLVSRAAEAKQAWDAVVAVHDLRPHEETWTAALTAQDAAQEARRLVEAFARLYRYDRGGEEIPSWRPDGWRHEMALQLGAAARGAVINKPWRPEAFPSRDIVSASRVARLRGDSPDMDCHFCSPGICDC